MFEIEKKEPYVLVVDDEADIAEIFEEALNGVGVATKTALSLSEAVATFQYHEPLLVISDFQIGGEGSGLDLFYKIKDINDSVPVIIVSAFITKVSKDQMLSDGVKEVLEKPIEDGDIQALVNRWVKGEESSPSPAESAPKSPPPLEGFLDEEAQMLKDLFIEESTELLAGIDNVIISLEDNPHDLDTLNELYRKIHTIKGGCGSVEGTHDLKNLSHSFENVLSLLKGSKLEVTNDLISLMMSCTDSLESLVKVLVDPSLESPPVEDLIEQLRIAEGNKIQPAGAGKEAPPKKPMAVKEPEQADEGVTVSNEKLDQFMDLAGDLVAFKNTFQGTLQQDSIPLDQRTQFEDMGRSLSKISDQIQLEIMEIRKVPLGSAFAKFPRTVRQVAMDFGKKIKLQIEGGTLEVDKTIARALSNSLIHVIRNSCDHGIESPEKREAAGKSPEGQVKLSAVQNDDQIDVTVWDDGGGINRERLLEKAEKVGIIKDRNNHDLSDEEVCGLIFHAGLSTAEKITDVSGRGVGMDAVKTAITRVNGEITVTSEMGKFTRMVFSIPAPRTVIIEHSVIVGCGDITLAIPLNSVAKISSLDPDTVNFSQTGWTHRYQDRIIPIAPFQKFLSKGFDDQASNEPSATELLVVIHHEERALGIRVDKVYKQIEAVVRPFDNLIEKIEGFKGTSLLAGDTLAYVLSAEEVIDYSMGKTKQVM